MECHEGVKMIKTFRGLIADGDQDIINLHTNDGKTGYKITKFQLMHNEPGQQHAEHTVKIYSELQDPSGIDNEIDFSNSTLLGAGYLVDSLDHSYPVTTIIIFDNMTINQDIYVTHEDTIGVNPVNYYIELEQISLDLNEATVATLQSIRSA